MSFPAALFQVLAGAAAATIVGYSLARLFTDGVTRAERLAWSFATGVLVQSVLYLVCVSAFPGSGPAPVLALDVVIVAATIVARRPLGGQVSTCHIGGQVATRPAVLLLLAVAGAAWLVFVVETVAEPMWATDYLAMWGLKGKTIFETGFVPRRLFQDPALEWGRPDHPLLVPLALATLASFSGAWNDQALGLFFALCELATLLAVFGFLGRRVSPLAGASAAALVSVCFPLYRAVHAGLAEIPLAFALVLVSCAFFDVLETGSRSAVARLFLASLLSAWTKPEGTLFVLLLAAVLWVRHRARLVEAWKSGGWALLVPPVLHASLMFLLGRPRPPRDFDPTLLEPHRWSELLSRFGMVLERIFRAEVLAAWVPVLAIGLFLLITRRGFADPLLAVFALQVLAYLMAFSISSHDPIWKVDSCFDRIMATLFPPFALVLGGRLPRAEKPSAHLQGSVRFERQPASRERLAKRLQTPA